MTVEYKETTRFDKIGKITVVEPGYKITLPRGKGWVERDMGDRRILTVIDKDSIEIDYRNSTESLFKHISREDEINVINRNTGLVIEPTSRRDRMLRKRIEYGWRKDET